MSNRVKVPVLNTPLEPDDGGYLTFIADYATQYKRNPQDPQWQPLLMYATQATVSPTAKAIGLYLLGEKTPRKKALREYGDWYLRVTNQENELATRFFGPDRE